MTTLFVNDTVTVDTWISVEGDQPVPEGENVILSLEKLAALSDKERTHRLGKLGVNLTADEAVKEIESHLNQLDLVSLEFPSFADGRAFSKAATLRSKYNFKGEVRAVGDIRIDQVEYMKRCGFDALLINHKPTIDSLQRGDETGLNLYYQPSVRADEATVVGRHRARRIA